MMKSEERRGYEDFFSFKEIEEPYDKSEEWKKGYERAEEELAFAMMDDWNIVNVESKLSK